MYTYFGIHHQKWPLVAKHHYFLISFWIVSDNKYIMDRLRLAGNRVTRLLPKVSWGRLHHARNLVRRNGSDNGCMNIDRLVLCLPQPICVCIICSAVHWRFFLWKRAPIMSISYYVWSFSLYVVFESSSNWMVIVLCFFHCIKPLISLMPFFCYSVPPTLSIWI